MQFSPHLEFHAYFVHWLLNDKIPAKSTHKQITSGIWTSSHLKPGSQKVRFLRSTIFYRSNFIWPDHFIWPANFKKPFLSVRISKVSSSRAPISVVIFRKVYGFLNFYKLWLLCRFQNSNFLDAKWNSESSSSPLNTILLVCHI